MSQRCFYSYMFSLEGTFCTRDSFLERTFDPSWFPCRGGAHCNCRLVGSIDVSLCGTCPHSDMVYTQFVLANSHTFTYALFLPVIMLYLPNLLPKFILIHGAKSPSPSVSNQNPSILVPPMLDKDRYGLPSANT